MTEEPKYKIADTRIYREWRDNLKDCIGLAQIGKRLERLAEGNPGYRRDFGTFSELKFKHGVGYRIYYTYHDQKLIILLAGGDKSTQTKDLETARDMAQNLKEGRDDDRF